MRVKIIAAMGKNRELGNKRNLPEWKLSTDLKRFKNLTYGSTVVMGRKNFESLPEKFRPLPNRKNIVLTSDKNWKVEGVETANSISEVLKKYEGVDTLWIIGGGEIYKQFLHFADELHITHVDGDFEADTFMPEFLKDFRATSAVKIKKDEKNSHDTIYTKYNRRLN